MRKILVLGMAMPALFLAGCGEGWESKLYNGFPYGNIRTAGHGVEYVRANMMPEKGPVIKAVEPEHKKIVAPEPPPIVKEEKSDTDKLINSGEKFFRDMQRK
ncbi:MAG: hypothetical protein H6867_06230 [Rhodospirillales bacterium]|nr:hypothetical protein [Rhodospirillales bacterium]MCB9995128.1 hypothetical protein [Rhodospirillales bacterium]